MNAEQRAAEMAAMRPEYTYQQIGHLWGVGRERVRQILKEFGHDDVMGWACKQIIKHCKSCGAEITFPMKQVRYFCNRACQIVYVGSHMTDRQREIVTTAIKLRGEGRSWHEVTKAVGWKSDGLGTSLPGRVKGWAAREGINVDLAFGFYAGRYRVARSRPLSSPPAAKAGHDG